MSLPSTKEILTLSNYYRYERDFLACTSSLRVRWVKIEHVLHFIHFLFCKKKLKYRRGKMFFSLYHKWVSSCNLCVLTIQILKSIKFNLQSLSSFTSLFVYLKYFSYLLLLILTHLKHSITLVRYRSMSLPEAPVEMAWLF